MPATEDIVVAFEAPGDLSGYDRSLPQDAQTKDFPTSFLDAMAVRENVFVNEQGIPLMMEADDDDARSCHWIIYAVSGTTRTPAGTLRLVPFPHEPHPVPGSSWEAPDDMEASELKFDHPPYIVDRKTTFHNGKEAYVKFGRWAVVKEYRGRGYGQKLIQKALDWIKANPIYFDKAAPGIGAEQTKWKGLVCIHAQKQVARTWSKFGFKIDDQMGEWTEGGIPHIGMFLRLDVPTPPAANFVDNKTSDDTASRYNH